MQNSEIVTQITSAIGGLSAWKMKLKAAIGQGNSALSPSEVRCLSLVTV